MPQLLMGVGGGAIPVVATTTWDNSNKGTNTNLTNGFLTATATAVATFTNARSIASSSTGLKYWEIHVDNNAGFIEIGFCNSTASLNNYLGNDLNGIGYVPSGTVTLNNNFAFATIQSYAAGDTICCAFDMGNKKLWFRKNGGNWNNDVIANQDPANNIGGISTSTMNAGPYFPAWTGHNLNEAATANFGGSAYAQTVPSGYGNW